MDNKTKKILRALHKEVGMEYKIISNEDLFDIVNAVVVMDFDQIMDAVNVLKEAGYIDIKIMTAEEICLSSTQKAEAALLEKEVVDKTKLNVGSYILTFVVSFVACFAACVLAKLILG